VNPRRLVCLAVGHKPAWDCDGFLWYRSWCLRCGKPYEVRKR
jgi:hypothetical protein